MNYEVIIHYENTEKKKIEVQCRVRDAVSEEEARNSAICKLREWDKNISSIDMVQVSPVSEITVYTKEDTDFDKIDDSSKSKDTKSEIFEIYYLNQGE